MLKAVLLCIVGVAVGSTLRDRSAPRLIKPSADQMPRLPLHRATLRDEAPVGGCQERDNCLSRPRIGFRRVRVLCALLRCIS
jgi:hypothetical protein